MGWHTLVASAIVLLMSGCSLFAGNDDAPAPIVQPAQTQPGPEQVVRPKLRSTRVAAALLKPTNPDQRLRVLRSGRADPFAALRSSRQSSTTNTSGAASSNGSGGSNRSGAAGAANARTTNTITVRTSRTSGRGQGGSGGSGATGSASSPTVVTGSLPPQAVARLPALPQPDLARKVQVTGIALVGGVPRAIVLAPNETTSRSVGPGDTLSNGQILVKRIDLSNPAEPFVVLEQIGTEVALGVGTAPVQLASAPTNLQVVPGLWYDNQK